MLATLILLAFAGLLLFAAAHDVATMTIPNWVSITIAGLFLPAAAIAGLSMEAVGIHLLIGAIGLIVTIGLFMLGVFGGGDAKLLAAVSLWAGPAGLSPMILGVALVGGLLAATVLLARRLVPVETAPAFIRKPLQDGAGVPYAVAISAGVLWAAPASPILLEILQIAGIVH